MRREVRQSSVRSAVFILKYVAFELSRLWSNRILNYVASETTHNRRKRTEGITAVVVLSPHSALPG